MPAKPLTPSFAAPHGPARIGRGEAILLAILAALAILLLAAWQIPPMLDWSRLRGAIAATAGARLGRPVRIEGQIRLSLLPRPMLMADRVALPDRGDGLSAQIGTLRLEVALSSLLAGHLVPRALALDDPQVRLPWPPPRGTKPPLPARAAREFSAMINGGTLHIGGLALHDITASLRTDPDTGAFSTQGNASVAGLPWRFSATLGAAGSDGVSAVSLTLDGRAAPGPIDIRGTGGALHGRLLPDGSLTGTMTLHGSDASRLGAGPALPWQVQGEIAADGQGLRAQALDLRLANSPGRAALAWDFGLPAALTVRAKLDRLAAGAWMFRLLPAAPYGGLTAELDLGADVLQLPHGALRAARLHASFGAAGAVVRTASASLPGEARVEASGTFGTDRAFNGSVHVSGKALHTTLQWLAGLPADRLPASLLATADLRAALAAGPGRFAFSSVHGRLDGSEVTGSLTLSTAARPSLAIALSTDRLPLAGWSGWPWLHEAPSAWLAGTGAGADATIDLRASEVAWGGLALSQGVLQAAATRAGLAVNRLALDLPGGHVEASGKLGSDGSLTAGRFDLAAQDASRLPLPWRAAPGLWQGGFHLALNGAGPRAGMTAQLRADLGDLRAEAEAHIDLTAPRMDATVTLRHPGTPRLAEALGVPGARAWLDDGSFAWLAHLTVSPGHVQARDFSLSAGALQMGGHLDAVLLPTGVRVGGSIDAPCLALPGLASIPQAPAVLDWLRAAEGRIDIRAARVLRDLAPMASDASATLLAGAGVVLLQDGHARAGAGVVAGEVAVDSTQQPLAVSLLASARDLAIPADDPGPAVALRNGVIDVAIDLLGHGRDRTGWLGDATGTVQADIRGTTLTGIDLQAAAAALRQGGGRLRERLHSALTSGQSALMTGSVSARLDGGVAQTAGRLSGAGGEVEVSGTIEPAHRAMNMRLVALPGVPSPPRLPIGLAGTWVLPQASADPGPGLAWAGIPATHGSGHAHARPRTTPHRTFSRRP